MQKLKADGYDLKQGKVTGTRTLGFDEIELKLAPDEEEQKEPKRVYHNRHSRRAMLAELRKLNKRRRKQLRKAWRP